MPNPLLLAALPKLFSLGSELITDKDKKAEFEFKAKEIANELDEALLNTTTVPWADGIVKILLATKVFIRPLGALGLTAFGAFPQYKGLEIDTALHSIFDGAFPGWMLSRHRLVSNGAEQARKT